MYTAYYGFEEKPFALSPDPKYLFLSATHREVLGHLVYGIEQGEGFMAISGEVGTGKTTLCRTLLDRLGSSCEIAFLFNPTLGPTDLIKAINAEFGLSTFGDSRPELIDILNTFLLEKHEDGRRVLVMIDEAQNLPDETLEQLRLLSNLESRTAKLMQIILIGQPELDEKLRTHELRPLRQRISVWWSLGPMTAPETAEYVHHRIRVASGTDRPIFSDKALARVHRYTGGIPRVINVLCDRALLAGYGEQRAQVSPKIVREVAREIRLDRTQTRRFPWAIAAASVVALVAGFGTAAWWLGRTPSEPRQTPPPVAAAPLPVPAAAPTAPTEAVAALPPDAERQPSEQEIVPAPLETAPAPIARPLEGALDALLALETPRNGNGLVLAATLTAWRFPAEGPTAPTFAQTLDTLEERGLSVMRITSPDELRQADIPTIVRLRTDGAARAGLVRAMSDGHVDLEGLVRGEIVRISQAELAARWAGTGYAAFRNFAGLPGLLHEGQAGYGVSWIQQALAGLGLYGGEPHGTFDADTRAAVEEFQRSAGIRVDGEMGPITQVRLYQAMPDYRLPVVALRDDARTASVP